MNKEGIRMMNDRNDFRKYAVRHLGMDGLTVDEVMAAQAQYLNPYILEERQLNVTQMDVFSRLMTPSGPGCSVR